MNDPHALAPSVNRLAAGSKRTGRLATGIASALLQDGELVECAVQGRFLDADAVMLLTNRRLLLVNDKLWKPDIISLGITRATTVQGWQDDRTAALVIQTGQPGATDPASASTIDRIVDRLIAQEMAARIRSRAAAAPS